MQSSDIQVEVFNNILKRKGQVTSQFLDVEAHRIAFSQGNWKLRLPREHPMVAELWAPGSGIIIRLRDKHFLSGPTETFAYEATAEDPLGTVVFIGADFNCIIYDATAWPVPSQPDVSLQVTASNDVRSGKAETLMRAYINANIGPSAPAARKGYFANKLVMGIDNGLGPLMNKSPRFTNLGVLAAQIGAYGNINFEVQYRNEDLILVTREGVDRSAFVRFDIRNGNLASESIQVTPPTVTRAIVAGQEEGVDRQLLMRTSTASLAAEVSWNRKIEQFIDQRQTSDVAELNQAGDEAVAAGGMSATGVKAVPTDSTNGVYAVDWDLGDKVTVVINGVETKTYITEVALVANKDGAGVGASIGDVTNFLEGTSLANTVANVENRVSNLERNAEWHAPRQVTPIPRSISSTTTWNKPDKLAYLKVRAWGAGGAGGGAPATTTGQAAGGSGGGSGGYAEMIIPAASLPSSLTVTVGLGGTPASGAIGGAGGDTTFGAFLTAAGGLGGNITAAGTGIATPTPGTGGGSSGSGGSGSFIGIGGSAGDRSIIVPGSYAWIGRGGQAPNGPQGGQSLNNADGTGGGSPGGGGSGSANGATQAARLGGPGAAGRCIVEEYFEAL